MFKKVGSLMVVVAMFAVLAACSGADTVNARESYVSIDINPSIEFIVDQDDIVTSYNLLNEDAEILCSDVDFIGMNIEDASELFVQLATEAGFIDVDSEDNAVLVTVIGSVDNEELCLELQERVRTRVRGYMVRNHINAEILTEDFTNEDLVAQANDLGISPGKLRLILLAQTYDENLTIEVGMDTAVKDLVSMIKDYHKDKLSSMTEEEKALFLEEKTALRQEFKEKLQEHINECGLLSPEEVSERLEERSQNQNSTTKDKWQDRVDKWQNRNNGRDRQRDDSNTTTEENGTSV